jgi:hypothetical protein
LLENAYNVDRKLMLTKNALPGNVSMTLYKAIRPLRSDGFGLASYLDTTRADLQWLYDHGREAARRWLASGPVVDSLSP